MKHFYILLIFALSTGFLPLRAQNPVWQNLTSNMQAVTGYGAYLSDIVCVGDNQAWVTRSNSTYIYHTTDGGQTWQSTLISYRTSGIDMWDEMNGYAVGAGGYIYRTTDGGASWPIIGQYGAFLSKVECIPSSDTCFVCGRDGSMAMIVGDSIYGMTTPTSSYLSGMCFPNSSREGWLCGGEGIFHYKNGSWIADQNFPPTEYFDIFMLDTLVGWAVGDNGLIVHTENGKDWVTQPIPYVTSMMGVHFINSQEGWVIGSIMGLILHTTDGGQSWETVAWGMTNNVLTSLYFTSSTNGYVIGYYSTVLRYAPLTALSHPSGSPDQFSLSSNYPNPFNPTTHMELVLPAQGMVRAQVYTIAGERIKTLIEAILPAGQHIIEWDGTDSNHRPVAGGVYLCRVQIGKHTVIRKMVLMR